MPSGGGGGIAAYNRHFLRAMATAGHTVTVLPFDGVGTAPSAITQLAPKGSKPAYTRALLRILITKQRFDLV